VIFFDKSPATPAVVTSASWDLRRQVDAIELTLSVKSFQVRQPEHVRLSAETPFRPTSRATRVTSPGEGIELVHHRVGWFLQLKDFAADVYVIFFDRSPPAMLSRPRRCGTCAVRFDAMSDVIGQVALCRRRQAPALGPASFAFVPTSARGRGWTSDANELSWSTMC